MKKLLPSIRRMRPLHDGRLEKFLRCKTKDPATSKEVGERLHGQDSWQLYAGQEGRLVLVLSMC